MRLSRSRTTRLSSNVAGMAAQFVFYQDPAFPMRPRLTPATGPGCSKNSTNCSLWTRIYDTYGSRSTRDILRGHMPVKLSTGIWNFPRLGRRQCPSTHSRPFGEPNDALPSGHAGVEAVPIFPRSRRKHFGPNGGTPKSRRSYCWAVAPSLDHHTWRRDANYNVGPRGGENQRICTTNPINRFRTIVTSLLFLLLKTSNQANVALSVDNARVWPHVNCTAP
jgi:hypothetical protein